MLQNNLVVIITNRKTIKASKSIAWVINYYKVYWIKDHCFKKVAYPIILKIYY